MPKLQSFKLLASHCATTQSPTASPVIRRRRRRRKTLRMLLHHDPPQTTDNVRVRQKLKDLLLSSPSPPPPPIKNRLEHEELLPAAPASAGLGLRFRTGSTFRRGGAAALGPVSSAFRHRLLRRAWRPVLLSIPE
ncbi:uncharacterized protein LOC113868085 [Abrus precatorius]|uniref:Uncharacterized protein LOC113868085 n=1 Tax=Abrus precatorius TaxID=3816 RepID=A0A8B8LSU4_ABRPR|nr:uncharacterized protein LOC113868085 [Abrus precatorius]